MVDFAKREVLISKEMSGRRYWFVKKWGQSNKDDCSRIIDTGFNGGALCSFNRLMQYVDYLKEICPKTAIVKTREKAEFAIGVRSLSNRRIRKQSLLGLEMNSRLWNRV